MSGEGMIPADSAWQPEDRRPGASGRRITCSGGPLDGNSFELPDDAIAFNFTAPRLAGVYRE